MVENESVSRSSCGIAITNHQSILVDGECLPIRSAQRGNVCGVTIYVHKGVESIVAGAVSADDLTGVVNCVSSFKGIRFVGTAEAEILNRVFGKEHRPMILAATLAIANRRPTTINTKCFTRGGTVHRTKGSDRLVSGRDECEKISVPVLAVTDDLPGIVNGARSVD